MVKDLLAASKALKMPLSLATQSYTCSFEQDFLAVWIILNFCFPIQQDISINISFAIQSLHEPISRHASKEKPVALFSIYDGHFGTKLLYSTDSGVQLFNAHVASKKCPERIQPLFQS